MRVQKPENEGNKMGEFSHFDCQGHAVMVDIADKAVTARTAIAQGSIQVSPEIMAAVAGHTVQKGDVLGVARVAGILGVKQTSALIPLCHPLSINKCSIDFAMDDVNQVITAVCTVKTEGKTGVEMEALTGVSVALLTIYDMCKAIDKHMQLSNIHLVHKAGGKSGDFCWNGGE
jgi:cyclic pyranopterin monophosphate synthase